tara:strand:- start:8992 stop:9138 length:147 start_codon:yes stop_codon:yes gene_type:complete
VDINVELVEGSDGVFDVLCNDNAIFSKSDKGRFPTHKEIIDLILQFNI